MIKNILGVAQVTYADTFFELGGDSMSLAMLQRYIQKDFDIQIPASQLYQIDLTVLELVNLVHRYKWAHNKCSLNWIVKGNSNQNIFMLHPITGEALATYSVLARQLANKIPSSPNLYGISARGLFNPLDVSQDITVIAQDCANAIQSIQPNGRYALVS